ncbi:50S ribosomal protein L9 [Emcibacter sp.]|uniref:50S ribosomal protein L9 n=1 Tax=Emcibacter sp. TaxID=1979954 RepID=UPI002AA6BE24|nr:50S ribosomal protein L9 [Emcibacter sp.]
MEVILLERVAKLGQIGDVVSVKNGFARNFLLPQNKALRATKANLEVFEAQRKEIEARNLEAKKEAEAVAAKMDDVSAIIIRSAGETGQLYGSVSTRDIVEVLAEQGYNINRSQVVLDKAIKALGIEEIEIRLHPEVSITVKINVARSAAEAEMQEQGVAAAAAEEAAAADISVEDYFETPEAAEAAEAVLSEETEEEAVEEIAAEETEEEKSE